MRWFCALLLVSTGAAHAQTTPPDAIIPVKAYCETRRILPTYIAAIRAQALGFAASQGLSRAKVTVTVTPFFKPGERDPQYLEPSAVVQLNQDFSFPSLADEKERARSLDFLSWG